MRKLSLNFTSIGLCSGFVAASLFFATPAQAQAFGYLGVKAGYSNLFVEGLKLFKTNMPAPDAGIFLNSFSAPSIPVGANLGFGYYFTPAFALRVEAEYLYRIGITRTRPSFNLQNGTNMSFDPNAKILVQSQTLLGSLYLDYYITQSFNIYASVGVGLNIYDTKLSAQEKQGNMSDASKVSKNAFAYQVGLGAGYAITENFWLDFNVRYIGLGKLEAAINVPPVAMNAKGVASVSALEVLFGMNYRF